MLLNKIVWLLHYILGLAVAAQWTLVIPNELHITNSNAIQSNGPDMMDMLKAYLNGIERYGNNSIILHPLDSWRLLDDVAGARTCIAQLRSRGSAIKDACLVVTSTSVLSQLADSTQNPLFLTQPLFYIHPAQVALVETEKSGVVSDSVYPAVQFLYVFHTSVWSLILLFILVVGALLTVFEISHPFQLGFHKRKSKSPKCLGIFESFFCVSFAVFLQTLSKSPKSSAGKTLILFWYPFCLLCILYYTFGLWEMRTSTVPKPLNLNINTQTICAKASFFCTKTTEDVTRVDTSVISSISTFDNETHLVGYLTNSFVANQLLNSGTIKRGNRKMQWLPKTFTTDAYGVAVITNKQQLQLQMDIHLQSLRETGEQQQILRQWNNPYSLLYSVNLSYSMYTSTPIRLIQMNGVFVFMIFGSLCAVVVHAAEFLYLSFVVKKKDYLPAEDVFVE